MRACVRACVRAGGQSCSHLTLAAFVCLLAFLNQSKLRLQRQVAAPTQPPNKRHSLPRSRSRRSEATRAIQMRPMQLASRPSNGLGQRIVHTLVEPAPAQTCATRAWSSGRSRQVYAQAKFAEERAPPPHMCAASAIMFSTPLLPFPLLCRIIFRYPSICGRRSTRGTT